MICSVTIPDIVLSINLINLKYHKFNLYYYKKLFLIKEAMSLNEKQLVQQIFFPPEVFLFLYRQNG